MRAVVLVGGLGTRLRPLTLATPKQLLPIVDRPMIEHVVRHLAEHGVHQAVLSLGYRPDAFHVAFPDRQCAGVELVYAVEPDPLDTAGAIRFAAEEAGIDEQFIVVNGDVLTDLDVTALVAEHAARGGEATISLHQVDEPSRYGVVPTAADGRVTAFVEKPPVGEAPCDLINAGTYVLEPAVLARIPTGRPASIERETFPAMVDDGTLYAVADGGTYWIDAGTPATYLAAQLDLLDGRRGEPVEGVCPGAAVEPGASVVRSVVRPGACVVAGASVVRSVILDGARIEPGARVEGSIVGVGAVVERDAVVTELSVLGEGVVVKQGARLRGAVRPEE